METPIAFAPGETPVCMAMGEPEPRSTHSAPESPKSLGSYCGG